MAALDDFVIKGDTMTFNIIHEDWGPGTLPFHNQATVRHLARHHRHELDVGVERERGHVDNRAGNMVDVDPGLRLRAPSA